MANKHYIYGLHGVAAALTQRPQSLEVLYLQAGRHDQRIKQLSKQADSAQVAVELRSRRQLDQLVQGRHQGVIARVSQPLAVANERELEQQVSSLQHQGKAPLLLALDGVTDPHNLGACLRTAETAGVDLVFAPKRRSAGLTPVVAKVACGALDRVPYCQVTNLARSLAYLSSCGLEIAGADERGDTSLFNWPLADSGLVLVMGAEGKGLRRLTREHCDRLLAIPMQGKINSLNVAVATGICLFEVVRQRQSKGRQ
jgi:23S rRNA (guanosine2251-2'-O)-methyltransferase